jgi:hypothetical protein
MQNNDQPSDIKKDRWIIALAGIVAVAILVLSDFGSHREVVYDCRDAHWHPDVPIEVKRQCAEMFKEHRDKIRREELEKQGKIIRT